MTGTDSSSAEVFDLDAELAKLPKGKSFVFGYAGRRWTLPHFVHADYRVRAQIEAAETITSADVSAMFERMFGLEQAEAWARVPQTGDAIILLFQQWVEHAAANPIRGASSRATRRRAAPAAKKATPVKRAPRKAAR